MTIPGQRAELGGATCGRRYEQRASSTKSGVAEPAALCTIPRGEPPSRPGNHGQVGAGEQSWQARRGGQGLLQQHGHHQGGGLAGHLLGG